MKNKIKRKKEYIWHNIRNQLKEYMPQTRSVQTVNFLAFSWSALYWIFVTKGLGFVN